MAWGRPVVANRHPDQSKVLEESGAGLAVAYEPKAFADAVIELLYDHGRAEAMGARGVDYVRKHRSYRALSANLERQYLKLLGIRREAMPTESCQ
jgi:glycosyltransferase involved in cell wall biosynthesis